jgi:hypothetical protein
LPSTVSHGTIDLHQWNRFQFQYTLFHPLVNARLYVILFAVALIERGIRVMQMLCDAIVARIGTASKDSKECMP